MNKLSPKKLNSFGPLLQILSPPRHRLTPLMITCNIPNKPNSAFNNVNRSFCNYSLNRQASSIHEQCEVKQFDSKYIFDKVWKRVESEVGPFNLTMPRDILFLIGAPGSGKGTVTPHLIEAQRSTNTPICMSSLLKSPSMQKLIDQGKMIDDETVLEHLIFAIMERDQSVPLIVDGFPRTQIQVECLVLLNQKLEQLYHASLNTDLSSRFPKPDFKVAILYVSKETSLSRQLKRGMEAKLHNQMVLKTGKGKLIEERSTDLSEELVLTRYKAFEQNMNSVTSLMKYFPFHMINADCQLNDVVNNLLEIFNSSYPQPKSSQLTRIDNQKAKPIWHGFNNPTSTSLEAFFI